jgi:hypothetical protein
MCNPASEQEPVEKALVVRHRIVGWARFHSSPSFIELAGAVAVKASQQSFRFGLAAIPDYILADHWWSPESASLVYASSASAKGGMPISQAADFFF